MIHIRQLLFLGYCLLLAGICLASSVLEPIQHSDIKLNSAKQRTSQFQDTTIDKYDHNGTLLYRLNSPYLQHQKNIGFDLQEPQFVYQPQRGAPVVIVAEKGSIANNSDLIELSGQVNLLNINNDHSQDYLDTSDVTIDLQNKKAYTDKRARLRQKDRVTTGIGMVTDLEAKTVSLQSKIQVIQSHQSDTGN